VPKWAWFALRRLRARYWRIAPPSPDVTGLPEYVPLEEIERRVSRWETVLRSEPAVAAGVSA
jgi:hypothetical protein